MSTSTKVYEHQSVDLERMSFLLTRYVSDEVLLAGGIPILIETMADELKRQIRVSFRKDVWGQVLDEVHVQYPADWWQAFKERWFVPLLRRQWFLRLTQVWPKLLPTVRYTRIDKQVQAVYPDLAWQDKRFHNVSVFVESEHRVQRDGMLLPLTGEDMVMMQNFLAAAIYRGAVGIVNDKQIQWVHGMIRRLYTE